jgi:hypothetical protein
MRAPSIVLAAIVAAGCTGYGTGPDERLTPAAVQGEYRLCTLRFTPSAGGLPPADLLATVIDPAPGTAGPPATLRLSGTSPSFELTYTRRDGAVQHVAGDMEFGDGSVFLYLDSRVPTSIRTEALLPPFHLDLVFHAAGPRLTAGDEVGGYWVRTADYAHAAGVSAQGLQDRVFGHLTAAFAAGGCG